MKKLTAVTILLAALALPALADRAPRGREPRESPVIRFIKKTLGIATNADYPTIPNP
jgi:hypothetical protein